MKRLLIESEDRKIREPWIIVRLEKEITKATTILETEPLPHKLIVEYKLLRYWISKYQEWENK